MKKKLIERVNRETILEYRSFLKNPSSYLILPEEFQTDQQKKVANTPLQKPYPENALLVDLMQPENVGGWKHISLFEALKKRRSVRQYSEKGISLEELSFLLWCCNGVKEINKHHGAATIRTVPSGGARHPYETYLIVFNVEGLQAGIYRYLPIEHKLLFKKPLEELKKDRMEKLVQQPFILKGAVLFLFATIPYRMEWRYSIFSSKVIAIEAGHIVQNLYMACEAINAGTCAIAAYNQTIADEILGIDGIDELVVYIAPVGKKKK